MYNPTTPGSPVRHFRRADIRADIHGWRNSLAMLSRLSRDILRQSRALLPAAGDSSAPIAPASSRCLLLSRFRSCLCTRMPPRSLRFTLCSLPSCADSHASDENPEVHQLSCDGPVAFEQNIRPRPNPTNSHFCVSTSGLPARRSPGLPFRPSPSLCLWLAFIAGRTPSRKCYKPRP
jgi:hypothetical protein